MGADHLIGSLAHADSERISIAEMMATDDTKWLLIEDLLIPSSYAAALVVNT